MALPQINVDISLDNPITLSLDGTQPQKPKSPAFRSENTTYQKYNELFHEVELYLNTSGQIADLGKGTNESNHVFYINPAAVLNLTIQETFNDWITQGTMTFMYLPEDAPESQVGGQTSSTITKGAKENGQALKSCQFRADGFDMLRFRVSPTNKKRNDVTGEPQTGKEFRFEDDDPKWCLSHLFSIYDIEDVTEKVPEINAQSSTYMKCIQIHFCDIRYQILKTTNIEYSTTIDTDNAPSNKNSGMYNEGVKFTGDAIIDIFNTVIKNDEIFDTTSSAAGELFPDPKADPDITWDKGGCEIFYTSPAGYTAFEDLTYVYSHHIGSKPLPNSTVHDLCILHTTRSKVHGSIEPLSLTPLSDFFEKSTNGEEPGELQLEHFFVTSATTKNPTFQRNSPISDATDRDLKTVKYGQIMNYSFVDMSPDTNGNLFCTSPVYSVDIKNRTFNIEFLNNDVETARKLITESYIAKLFSANKNEPNEKLFLPAIHTSKKTSNVFPVYSLNGDNKEARQRNGIHQLLYTGLFQNACIKFSTLGLTLRSPGTFIAIDKTTGNLDNDYANKLYGQWFVIKVEHIFEAGSYINNIYAVKMHRHTDAKTQFPRTL